MDLISTTLPIVYTTQILIPGYLLKIQLPFDENFSLLKYYQNSKLAPAVLLGIIPKKDYEQMDDIIGTVGIIKDMQHDSKILNIIVQGSYRFLLGENTVEKPLKIHKLIMLNNFNKLSGDEKEKMELTTKFKRVFYEFLLNKKKLSLNEIKIITAWKIIFLNTVHLYIHVDYCLKNFIILTPADVYKILRATNLNSLLNYTIDLLKQEKIYQSNSTFELTGLVPVQLTMVNSIMSDVVKPLLEKFSSTSLELKTLENKINNSKMPLPVHNSIINEFNRFKKMSTVSPDYSIYMNYISFVVNLPWNKSTIETLDFKKAKNILQLNHFGMDKVKQRILQFIAVRILNPERRGPILCFIGPAGVGKTTIAKTIANSLNRTFKRISVGGINSFSDIKGHRKTYMGAMPGCIIQAISQAQTNNPIILLDEIDKMHKGSNGDPAAALLEVLDPEQNNLFVDSYVNLPFDLSQVMFISTANNADRIPQTLRDRLEIIYLKGYELDEKMQIAEHYLIPKIITDFKMNEALITITQSAIKTIIQNYTKEAGVRELQRKLEAIYHYIAVQLIENVDKKIKNYVITPESLSNIFGGKSYDTKNILIENLKLHNQVGVAIGLSKTQIDGKIQVIEASYNLSPKNSNSLFLTGRAGQTLKESAQIAFNWVESFIVKNKLGIKNFVAHVHFPVGGIPKDGPSAGITIVCALISLFWKIPLKPMIAMTGEISLQGFVLPVGGIKEKILAAYNSDIRTVIIPKHNLKDIKSLSKNVQEDINIIPATHILEVLEVVIPGGLEFLRNPTPNMIMLKSKI